MARGHRGLGDAPSEDEGGHENAVRDLDDQDGRDGLEGKLGNGGDGPDQRILISVQAGVLLEAEDGSVSEHRLVEDLEEVDPDENDQNHPVRLPTDALVLRAHRCQHGHSRSLDAGTRCTSSSVSSTRSMFAASTGLAVPSRSTSSA
jgi:hypothetical protein